MREEIAYLVVLGAFGGLMGITWIVGGVAIFWATVATIVGTAIWLIRQKSTHDTSSS